MAQNAFERIRIDAPDTNHFTLPFDNKLTLDMGKLTPVMVQETFPGDSFTIRPEMFLRFAPLLYPIMHRIDATIHFFYVPNRISWNKWENFCQLEDVVPPYIMGTTGEDAEPLEVKVSRLFDYLGLPLADNITEAISAFPLLAYLRIFNEYYQDQNNDSEYQALRDKLKELANMSGRLAPSDFSATATNYDEIAGLDRRAWAFDYFTACLPWAQKGQAVTIPLELQDLPVSVATMEKIIGGGDPDFPFPLTSGAAGLIGVDGDAVQINGIADASNALISGTITQLRTAYQLQRFLEVNARSGTRYPENIKAHWNVNVGDARISRPEYIGGIKNNIVISEVLQTSQSTADSALGDYSGHATGLIGGNTIRCYCPEHGYIIGILSVMPQTAYFQGIPKKFTRGAYIDWPTPEFAHIGEQAVKKMEVYHANDGDNHETFGYQQRFAELKYNPSECHGQMRTTMLSFHLARKFDTRPLLNADFIYCNPGKRIFAVEDEDTDSLYAHIWFNITAKRKFPYYTDPAGIV